MPSKPLIIVSHSPRLHFIGVRDIFAEELFSSGENLCYPKKIVHFPHKSAEKISFSQIRQGGGCAPPLTSYNCDPVLQHNSRLKTKGLAICNVGWDIAELFDILFQLQVNDSFPVKSVLQQLTYVDTTIHIGYYCLFLCSKFLR